MAQVKAYLCGPMRNIEQFNFPAFMHGAARLRDAGFEVFNPAEKEVNATFTMREALSMDLSWICEQADMVVVLPGWEKSLGANAEVRTAWALGLPVLTLDGAVKQGGTVKPKGWD